MFAATWRRRISECLISALDMRVCEIYRFVCMHTHATVNWLKELDGYTRQFNMHFLRAETKLSLFRQTNPFAGGNNE